MLITVNYTEFLRDFVLIIIVVVLTSILQENK
jgi:hypothetical protein